MIKHVSNLKPVQQYNNISKTGEVVTFQSIKNPFVESKISFKGNNVDWAKSDSLGQLNFSETPTRINNPNKGDNKVKQVFVNNKTIKFFNTDNLENTKPFAEINLAKNYDSNKLQVGYQDNNGGFALKLWDSETKTSYVLFDNKNNSSAVSIPGKFEASVNKSAPTLSFQGVSKTENEHTENQLDEKLKDAIVVGMFGGFGTRLIGVSYPNTKPTTKLGKYSFQNNMLSILEKAGYKNVGCSLYHGADIAKQDILSANNDLNINFAQQDDKTGNLGTAGAVRHTVEHILTNQIADKISGLGSQEAEKELNKLIGNDLTKEILAKLDKTDRNLDVQLKELAIKDPEIREKIFTKRIDNIPFITVVSGDHVTDINMREFAKKHLETNSKFTLAVKEIDDNIKSQGGDKCPYGCAVVLNQEEGKIVGFKEKPFWTQNPKNDLPEDKVFNPKTDKWINTGIYILSPEALKKIPSEHQIKDNKDQKGEGAKSDGTDFGKDIIPQLLKEYGSLQAYGFNEHWVDVGNNQAMQEEVNYLVDNVNKNQGVSSLLPGQEFNFDGKSAISKKAQVSSINTLSKNTHLLVNDNAKLEGDVKVDGTVYIGSNATVPSGTYKNVWIEKLDKPLFNKSLNING